MSAVFTFRESPMRESPMHHYIVHYSGEMGLKGKSTRNRFINRIMHNLSDALKNEGIRFQLDRRWTRIRIESDSEAVPEIARRIFGVSSVATARRESWSDFDDLVAKGAEAFKELVAGRTFAVRARRGEQAQRIPFKSPELERALGAALYPFAAGVDLKDPEVEARVDLHGQEAFFYDHTVSGEGGLPLGAEGRALTLFSGGFDSPVASWSLMRRGVRQDFLFCNLGGEKHTQEVIAVLKALVDRWCYGYRPRLFILDFRPVVEDLKAQAPGPLWQVLLKRLMIKAADRMAFYLKASALITGESVGQVSSQTLQNLDVISRVSERPILRPMVSWNKEDIVALARRIGTHDTSIKVPEYCGLQAGTGPAIHARLEQVESSEQTLDEAILIRAIEERAVIDLRSLDLEASRAPELEVESVPAGAHLIDVRSAASFERWHPEGAVRWSYPDVLRHLETFDRDQSYVVYCEVGLKSAHVAEALNRIGVRAFHLRRGVQTLRKAELEADPALADLISPVLRDPTT